MELGVRRFSDFNIVRREIKCATPKVDSTVTKKMSYRQIHISPITLEDREREIERNT